MLSPLPARSQLYEVGCLFSLRAGPDLTKTGQCNSENDGRLAYPFSAGPICSLKARSTVNMTSKCCLLCAADHVVKDWRQHMPLCGLGN